MNNKSQNLLLVGGVAILLAVLLILSLYHAKRLHSQPVEYQDYCAWAISIGATETVEFQKVCEKVSV